MPATSTDEGAILESIGEIIHTTNLGPASDVQIKATTRLIDELGFDSVSMLELVTAIEDRFDITIDFEDLDIEVLNVAGLLAALVARKAAE